MCGGRGSDARLALLLSRFGLLEFLLGTAAADAEDLPRMTEEAKELAADPAQRMRVAEECLTLIVQVFTELPHMSAAQQLRRELVHCLCIKPQAHSALLKRAPLALGGTKQTVAEDDLDRVIAAVAVRQQRSGLRAATFTLQPRLLEEFDPYFVRADAERACMSFKALCFSGLRSRHQTLSFGYALKLRPLPTMCKRERHTRRIDACSSL